MTLLVFMAAVEESTWHIAGMCARGREPRMLCGHRLRGPVHRRLTGPLPDDGRIPCEACAAVLAAFRSIRELPSPGSITGYFSGRLPVADEEPEWPGDEPDAPWNARGGNDRSDNSAARPDSAALLPA